MIVLIPAYQPTARLADVARELRLFAPDLKVVVVDDGSGTAYDAAFRAATAEDADVLRYEHNRGKGHALKVGLRHILDTHPGEDVVTADSDGQHSTADIVRVAERLRSSQGALVLGGRRFAGSVPLRSRFGNALTRGAFQLATGHAVHDTQTGLRGLPATMLEWLTSIEGDRFEYELRMLLRCAEKGQRIDEIPIETIYLEQNAGSHFRPVVDSLRVLRPLLAFAAVSFGSFVIDVVALELIFLLSGSLAASVVGARLLSGTVNFFANRKVVFDSTDRRTLRRQALRYLVLAAALLASSYALLDVLTLGGVPLLLAKVVTDVALYIVSYQAQRALVFGRRRGAARALAPVGGLTTAGTTPVNS